MTFAKNVFLLLFTFFTLGTANAGEKKALIAVASNFTETARELAVAFEAETSGTIQFSFGSTGKHFSQIENGAPFDAFLSADAERPRLLKEKGKAVDGVVFTYAMGRLALWSSSGILSGGGENFLRAGEFKRLAIAKPELAPYGAAAKKVLIGMNMWDKVQARLVYGDNISQTFQFVETGNADFGFVAWSQVKELKQPRGSSWQVPARLHDPIAQDAILLTDNKVARDFLKFMQSPKGKQIIEAHGYDLP
ncbi:molybdate ABC transporter substrate-binding protein [Candidatus Sumerlaeota bacterium]|nr:molybdate ABC transporter substrate-binding protein [Candidatus Sumerlaeota bacterium]